MKFPHRVVVTGLVPSPRWDFRWRKLETCLAGQSGIGPVTRFPAITYEVRIAGEVKIFWFFFVHEKKEQKKMDQFIHYAVVQQNGPGSKWIRFAGGLARKSRVIDRRWHGGLPSIEEQHSRLIERDLVVSVLLYSNGNRKYGGLDRSRHSIWIAGPNYAYRRQPASGALDRWSLSLPSQKAWMSWLPVVPESTICGGMALGALRPCGLYQLANDDPTKASRPYDQDRDGLLLQKGYRNLNSWNIGTCWKAWSDNFGGSCWIRNVCRRLIHDQPQLPRAQELLVRWPTLWKMRP